MSQPPGKAVADAGECAVEAWVSVEAPAAWEETPAAPSAAAEALAEADPVEAEPAAGLLEVAAVSAEGEAEERGVGAAVAPR
jgi:hypothetical protein